MKREKKRKLSAKDLRELGANPDRVRRVIPADGGRQRVEAGGASKRRTKGSREKGAR